MPEQGIENESKKFQGAVGTIATGIPEQSSKGDGQNNESDLPIRERNKGVVTSGGYIEKEAEITSIPKEELVELTEEQMERSIDIYLISAKKEGIVSINAFEYKRSFPKAFQELLKYTAKKSHMSENELNGDTMIGILLYSPRTVLFDFLDDSDIYLNIHGKKNMWKYNIDDKPSEDTYVKRAECEMAGYKAAFQKLEEKLNSK